MKTNLHLAHKTLALLFILFLLLSSCLKDSGNNHYWANPAVLQMGDSIVVAEVWAEKSNRNDLINLQLLIKNENLHSYYIFLEFQKSRISEAIYFLKNNPEKDEDLEIHLRINNDKYPGDVVSNFTLDTNHPNNIISFENLKHNRIDFNLEMRLYEPKQKFRKDTFELKSLSTINCPIRVFD